jgi:hypothetical protein
MTATGTRSLSPLRRVAERKRRAARRTAPGRAAPGRSGLARRLGTALLLWHALAAGAAAGTTCSTDCAQTACTVDCTEDDVRTAVKRANDCLGNPAWTGRTITVATSGCTIPMVNDQSMATAFPNSSCAGDFEQYAVCLTNSDIRFRGEGAVFLFTGVGTCAQCSGSCPPPQPGLFTIKGHRNTLEDFTFRYFPEGIHIRAGDGHTVDGVTSDRICEDAITVEAGSGHAIRNSTLIGSQPPDPGRSCFLANGSSGACGTDKAIQVNGGSATIELNTIDSISQPVGVAAGTHVIAGNSTTGSSASQNVCQSYTVSGPSAVATFTGNTIDHCKFGIRVDDGALVVAEGNTITNPWVAAFHVRGAGRLKGESNRVRTRSGGFTHLSDVQRGILVARNDRRARVDLGGGDFEARSVVDGTPCASGGDCSTGGNKFCSTGAGVQTDIWNVTDCPCLHQICNGALGVCTVGACAPLDAEGRCAGTGGGGASIGARNNCFAGGEPLVELKDSGAGTAATGGATPCAPADCAF